MNKKMIFVVSTLIVMDLALAHSLLKMNDDFTIYALNVGQGDAILITTPDQHHILMDGGDGNVILPELGEVLPYLYSEIDLLILSHPHADHVEGLIPVLQRFDVNNVLISAPAYDSLIYDAFLDKIDGKQVFFADDDMDFRLGDTFLDVLYPFDPFTGLEVENVNNVSPVIRVEYGGKSILLTGDAEQEVEAVLLAASVDVKADVLKAGHHGSRTSSTLAFLEAVDPAIMIISAGVDNSYGHPHEETLEKAADLGIQVFRTDLDGRIKLGFSQF